MKRGWMSRRIEKILVSLVCVWLGVWKNGGKENFVWLKIKFV